MRGRLRLLVLLGIGPVLAVLGSIVFQVIAVGGVIHRWAVAGLAVTVAALTCWASWSSILELSELDS